MASTPDWTRFVRFVAEDGKEYGGEVDGDVDDEVGQALLEGKPLKARVLQSTSPLDSGEFTGEVKTIEKILSPLTAAEVGTIRCIGLNYKDHAAEMKFALPTYPELFLKPGTALTGPCDPVELPPETGTQIDAEVELAIVIGKTCKNVSREQALEYVLGYTVANDLTARDVQKRGSQWSYCKSFDGFCPLGPVLVSAKAIPDPSVLQVKTELNGRVMQQQLVSDMIFSIPEIIEYLSKGSTLEKGTVILTGTPAGIGASYSPPIFLKEGDKLLVSISHGLGSLTNQFVAAKDRDIAHESMRLGMRHVVEDAAGNVYQAVVKGVEM